MAVGCFAAIGAVLRAVVAVGASLVTFAVSSVGAAVFLSGILSLYAILFLFMPMTYSARTVLAEVGVAAERFNTALEPIADTLETLFGCTLDDVTELWNRVMRFLFGVVRAILNILDGLGVDGLPDWYQWGDRHVRAAHDVLRMVRARTEADRRAAVAANATLSDWERVQHMFRAPGERDVGTDVAGLICTVSDATFGFIGDVLDIYRTAFVGFVEFVGGFYDVVDGFNRAYIEMLVLWLLNFVVEEIPLLGCIIDVDSLDLTDPGTYFFSPGAMLHCLCPAYGDDDSVPNDIPLAIVGCFCPLNGNTNIVTVLLACTHLDVVVDQIHTIRDQMLAWLDGRLNTLESGVNFIKGAADGLLGTLNTVVGAIEKALGSIGFRDGEYIGPGGLIYSNATMRVIYLEKSNCPVCPAAFTPIPPPPPPRTPAPPAFAFQASLAEKMDARRARARAARLAIQARLERDWAPVLDGSMFASFDARVAARLGPAAGARAAVMHAGLAAFFAQLPAAWRATTIHGVVAALTTPEILRGAAAMRDVVDAHRAAAPGPSPFRRGVAQARAAVRALLPAERMAPLVAELRAAGEHAAADEAAAWAGRADAYAWARGLPQRGAAARKARDAEELRATRILQREMDAAVRANSVVVHAGAYGASFVVGLFSSLVYAPGALLSGVASLLAVLAGFLVTGFTVLLPIVGQVASAFFYNIANPDAAPRNDVVTPLVNVFYPLIANSFSGQGYTEAALQAAFARVVDIAELQLVWGASELLRAGLTAVARPTGMRLGPDGLPDGDFGGWLVARVLDAPVDEPCVTSADVEDYPCRLIGDPRVECTAEWPSVKGVCVGSDYACTLSDECDGAVCLDPPFYDVECVPGACDGGVGRCMAPCFVNESCSDGQCLNRDTIFMDCTPEAPCTRCAGVAFPLRPLKNVSLPRLHTPTVYDCGAIGIQLDDTDFWNTDAFRAHGLSWRLLFTWDHLRFHLKCVRILYQAGRVLLGWIVAEWRVPKTLVFAPLVSQFLLFVPAGPIVAGSAVALGGDFAAGVVGGAAGLTSAGEALQAWPWPLPYLGDELVFVGNYTATGAEPQCIASAIPPGGWGLLDVFVLYTLVTLAFASTLVLSVVLLAWTTCLFPGRVLLAAGRLGLAGARLSRAGALPSAATPVYGAAPDAVGVVHHRHRLARTHPLRHPHVDDVHVLGVRVRRTRKPRRPPSWAEAAQDGLEIGLRAVPHVVARGGRVLAHEWPDLLHDRHGRMRDRMLMIRDTN